MRNPVGQKLRHAALLMALEDMEAWLEMGGCWGVLRWYCAVLAGSAALPPSCPIATSCAMIGTPCPCPLV